MYPPSLVCCCRFIIGKGGGKDKINPSKRKPGKSIMTTLVSLLHIHFYQTITPAHQTSPSKSTIKFAHQTKPSKS